MLTLKTEEDLQSLQLNQVEEGYRLEFKRQINLRSKADKIEAAKDVSAFANADGGQIIVGLTEKRLQDGSVVAGPVHAQHDGGFPEQLEAVLHSTIQPMVRFRIDPIELSGGGRVWVINVYPSYGNELHMVSGYKEMRFHRRGEKTTQLMTEPEVREAYVRIAIARRALENELLEEVARQTAFLSADHEAIFVWPLFGHRGLINPRIRGPHWGNELTKECRFSEWHGALNSLHVFSHGYRSPTKHDDTLAARVVTVARTGLVCFCRNLTPVSRPLCLDALLNNLLAAIELADYILTQAGHFGPVRILQRMQLCQQVTTIDPHLEDGEQQVVPGTYDFTVPEVALPELAGDYAGIAREVMDQLSQTCGRSRCYWFNESGEFEPLRGHFLTARTMLIRPKS